MASDKVFISKELTLTASMQSVYVVSKDRTFKSTRILISNTAAPAVTIRVCYVPNGAAAAQGNAALWDCAMFPNTYIELKGGQFIGRLGSIQASASTPGVVNIFVSGEEIN